MCGKEKIMDLLQRIEYVVERLDGDYAYLRKAGESVDVAAGEEEELKCVARALLPEAVGEGSRLAYEWMEYTLL